MIYIVVALCIVAWLVHLGWWLWKPYVAYRQPVWGTWHVGKRKGPYPFRNVAMTHEAVKCRDKDHALDVEVMLCCAPEHIAAREYDRLRNTGETHGFRRKLS